MKYAGYAIVALGALVILTSVCMGWLGRGFTTDTTEPPNAPLPGGFDSKAKIIALEFARTASDVEAIVGDKGDKNREVMKKVIDVDTYFILSYGLLFALLGFLIGQGESRWAGWLGFVVAICAAGTAIFDFIENSHIRQVLDTPLSATTTDMVIAIRDATLIKWCLLFITALLLAGAIFYVNAESNTFPFWLSRIGGVFLLAGALVGLIGLYFVRLIPIAPMILAPGMLSVLILALAYPPSFWWKA